jgi:phosphate transport system permease protein
MTWLANTRATVPSHGMLADRAMTLGLALVFGLACCLVVVICVTVASGSKPLLAEVSPVRFLSDPSWHPTMGQYGLVPMLAGSALTAAGAIGLALPLAAGLAAALHFYLPARIAGPARGALFIAAATPSVIYGFWGLTRVVPAIATVAPPGPSLLAGIILLTLMILPTTALLIDIAISKLPRPLMNGARALGADQSLICFGLALPVIWPAVLSAGLLGLGRALGETVVVVMVTGNRAELPGTLFDPVRTLTATVALEMGYAQPLHAAALFFCILLLIAIAVALAIGVHVATGHQQAGRVDV